MKSKTVPLQAWTGPEISRKLRFLDFMTQRYRMVVRLSGLRNCRIYPRKLSCYSFVLEAESTPEP